MKLAKFMFEALLLRAVPGLLNVAVLLMLGSWMSLRDYGLFSTALVVTGFLAVMVFGPLQFSVVSQHAGHAARGTAPDYESSYVSAILILAGCTVPVGVLALWLELVPLEWVFAVAAFGAYSSFQELLRARMQLWAFGISSMAQSVLYVGMVVLLARSHPTPALALGIFSTSYAAASVVSLALLRFPAIRWPNLTLLKTTAKIGAGYIGSSAAENLLNLGMRYIAMVHGGAQMLGIFSFCVDLAQRTVGFLINAASFAFIPLAFRNDADGAASDFGQTLRKGALVSVGLSACLMVGIFVVRGTGLIPALNGEPFAPGVFAIVAVATVANRLKKLLTDPYAMRAGKPQALMIGYIVGGPLALFMGFFAFRAQIPELGATAYLLGYLVAVLISAWLVRRHVIRPQSRQIDRERNPQETELRR